MASSSETGLSLLLEATAVLSHGRSIASGGSRPKPVFYIGFDKRPVLLKAADQAARSGWSEMRPTPAVRLPKRVNAMNS